MSPDQITIRQQAEAVECCFLEWKNSVERLERLPIGRGGVDAPVLELKRQRVLALKEASESLHRWADKVEDRVSGGAA